MWRRRRGGVFGMALRRKKEMITRDFASILYGPNRRIWIPSWSFGTTPTSTSISMAVRLLRPNFT
jgi:hypothetical protein